MSKEHSFKPFEVLKDRIVVSRELVELDDGTHALIETQTKIPEEIEMDVIENDFRILGLDGGQIDVTSSKEEKAESATRLFNLHLVSQEQIKKRKGRFKSSEEKKKSNSG